MKMKNITKLFAALLSIALFSGCAIHSGYMNNSASLSQANFNYVKKSISGSVYTTQVFGIGGLEKEAMVEEAKKEMLNENPLQPNQALANLTVNWKNSFYIVVIETKCTVTADVIEFN
jgi:hypothetical protein